MIELDRLTYTYPNKSRPALAGISLGIEEGEFVLLAGPSGAGKSTLLRCLNGLVPHFTGGVVSGRIRVAGHDPITEGPAALSRVVGFVFQDPTLLPWRSVRGNVELPLELRGAPYHRRQVHFLH